MNLELTVLWDFTSFREAVLAHTDERPSRYYSVNGQPRSPSPYPWDGNLYVAQPDVRYVTGSGLGEYHFSGNSITFTGRRLSLYDGSEFCRLVLVRGEHNNDLDKLLIQIMDKGSVASTVEAVIQHCVLRTSMPHLGTGLRYRDAP